MTNSLVAAEVLEPRQVMTVTSPISLSTAQSNVTSTQLALETARTNFTTTMTGLETTFNGDIGAHALTANGLITGYETTFDTNVGTINGALDLVVSGLTSAFGGLVDGHETTFDGAIASARLAFQSAMSGPQTALETALDAAQSFFDGQLTSADGTLTGTINGLRTTLDGTVTSQQTLSRGIIDGFNSSFGTFAVGEHATYSTQELVFWNAYLAAMDSSPTGQQGIYNASLASAAATRDGIHSLYPSITYNPEILIGTSGYQALLDGANLALQTALTTARNNFGNDVSTHEQDFQDAVYGTGGAMSNFNAAITSANTELDGKIDTANDNYDTFVDPAESLYQTTVTGPSGLLATFESNVATIETVYTDAVAVANDARQGSIDIAKGDFDDAGETAESKYVIWGTGKNPLGGTQTRTFTRETYTPLFPGLHPFWKMKFSVVDSNGHTAATSLNIKKLPVLMAGGTPISTTVTTTTIGGAPWTCTIDVFTESVPSTDDDAGNAFDEAMDDLTEATTDAIDTLADDLSDTIADLQETLQTQIAAANTAYDNAMNNPSTGITQTFMNAVGVAGGMMGTNSGTHYSTYQSTIMPLMMSSMTMPGMPSTTTMNALQQATKDYALRIIGEEVTYTNSVGTAYTSYVSQERAADTARDITIVNFINNYLQQAINAVDAFQADAMGQFRQWLDGMTDLEAGKANQDAVELAALQNSANDAAQAFGLAVNVADEAYAIAESNAARARTQGVAAEVESFRNGEMAARVPLLQTIATGSKNWQTEYTAAIGGSSGWQVDAATAQNAFHVAASNSGETLQNNLLGEQTTYTNAVTLAVQGWVTTVSSGIASLWASYMGGGADVTAVANAWAAYDQAAALAWGALTDAEAGLFESYGNSEAGAHKTASQNVSAQNITRMTNIGGELMAYDGVVGPALETARQGAAGALNPWMNTVAAGERGATNQRATAGNTYELAQAPLVKLANDGGVNASHAFTASVIGDSTPFIQSVIAQNQSSQHLRIGEYNTLTTNTRIARTTQAQDDRGSWTTFATSAASADDPLVNAAAQTMKAQAVLGAVNRFETTAMQPLSNFTNYGSQRQPIPLEGTILAAARMNDAAARGVGGLAGGVDPSAMERYIEESTKPGTIRHIPLRAISPVPNAAARITNATVNPFPTVFGLIPSNPTAVLTPAEHALGQHLGPVGNGSAFISASMHPFGASGIQGDVLLYIDIDKAVANGAVFVSEADLRSDMRRLSTLPGFESRVGMWFTAQIGEREVLFRGPIPPAAVDTVAMRSLRYVGRGVQLVGVVQTAVDVGQAAQLSYQNRSPAPIVAETVRQVGGWAGAWLGVKAGGAIGTACGAPTGPGAVVSGIGGAIVGGIAGYFGADWLADYIYEN